MIAVAWKWIGDDERWAGVSEADRAALELALRLAETTAPATANTTARSDDGSVTGGGVTVISVGPPQVERALREALAVGATRAVRVEAPAGLASTAVAGALATVAAGAQWVLCGAASTDRGSGSVPAFLAAELGAVQALGLVGLETAAAGVGELRAIRRLDGGRREVLAVPSPAVVSVEGGVSRLRRASLPAEIAARTASIDVVAGPAGPVEHAAAVRPYRPRPRAMAAPKGDALTRIRVLTGAVTASGAGSSPGAASTTETVVLDPAAAAERILATLRAWGHVGG